MCSILPFQRIQVSSAYVIVQNFTSHASLPAKKEQRRRARRSKEQSDLSLRSRRQQKTFPHFRFCFYFLTNLFRWTHKVWGQQVRGETWAWWAVQPYSTSLSLTVARQQCWDTTVLLLVPWFWRQPAHFQFEQKDIWARLQGTFGDTS